MTLDGRLLCNMAHSSYIDHCGWSSGEVRFFFFPLVLTLHYLGLSLPVHILGTDYEEFTKQRHNGKFLIKAIELQNGLKTGDQSNKERCNSMKRENTGTKKTNRIIPKLGHTQGYLSMILFAKQITLDLSWKPKRQSGGMENTTLIQNEGEIIGPEIY